MRVKFNEKTGSPVIELEEKDVNDAIAIKAMLESDGYKTLIQYYAVAREELIERLTQFPKTEAEIRKTALIGSVLKGFNEALAIPERIIKRAQEYIEERETEKKREEEQNKNGQNDDE